MHAANSDAAARARSTRRRGRVDAAAQRTQEEHTCASQHARISQLVAQQGRHMPGSLRTATAVSLREAWRWALEPVGEEGEMLVLFDHAGEGARDGDERDTDMEVRAAVMNTSFGRGLYTTGTVQKGQNIGWYDGDNITEEQYCKLTEETGLRHTLEAPGNTYINGIHSRTGMQYANSGRNDRRNTASYTPGTAMLQANTNMLAGQEVILAYGWSAAAWAEIDSGVVGMCAWEERAPEGGLGVTGGQYIEEIVTARPGKGIGAHMLRQARHSWFSRGGSITGGTVELAAHKGNTATEWYGRLGMQVCRWWDRAQGEWELRGTGLYVPEGPSEAQGQEGGIIMRAPGLVLDRALHNRQERRGAGGGNITYQLINNGITELRERGLLEGVRAMANRVYAGQRWWVEGERSHIECLYRKPSPACPTRFIIAVTRGAGDVHTHTHEEYEAQGEEADELREETGHDAVEGRASETAGPGGAQPPMTARKRTRKQQAADDRTRKKPRTGDG